MANTAHRRPGRFTVAPGRDGPDVERVARAAGHVVVEKAASLTP